MASTFKIVIAAEDKASRVVRGVQGSVSQFEKRFDSVGRALFSATNEVSRFGREVGFLSRGLPALTIGGIATAVVGLGNAWGNTGMRLSNASRVMGISASQILKLESAARLGGISATEMDSSLQGLGNTLQDARFGRNPQVATLMNSWGMSIKRTKDGAIDTVAALTDVSDIVQKILGNGGTIQAASKVTDAFNVSGLLPILTQKGELQRLLAKSGQINGNISDDDIRKAKEYAEQVNALSQSFENLARSAGKVVIPHLQSTVDQATQFLNGNADGSVGPDAQRSIGDRLRQGAERFGNNLREKGLLTNVEAASQFDAANDPRTAGIVQDFIKKGGWSSDAAAGLAANAYRESKFNPQAVGDNGNAVGIFQWHPDRQAEFKRLTGKELRSATLDEQLWYANYELRYGAERQAGQRLAGAKDAYEAADIVTRQYERPNQPDIESSIRGRSAVAIADPAMAHRINAGNFTYSGAAKYAGQLVDGMRAAHDQGNGIWSGEQQVGHQTLLIPGPQLNSAGQEAAPRLYRASDDHDQNVGRMQDAASKEPQLVKVQIEMANAPRGTRVQAQGSGGVQASTRIGYAMGAGG